MTSLTCLKPFFLGSAGEQAFGIRPSLLTLSGRFSVVAETGSVSYSPNKNHCRRHSVTAQVVAAALALNCLYRLQVRGEGGEKRGVSLWEKKSSAGIRMLVVRLHDSSKVLFYCEHLASNGVKTTPSLRNEALEYNPTKPGQTSARSQWWHVGVCGRLQQ